MKQRFQHFFPVSRSDLLFVNHLVDHLLGDAGQGPLFAVENRHTLTKEHVGEYSEMIILSGEQSGSEHQNILTVPNIKIAYILYYRIIMIDASMFKHHLNVAAASLTTLDTIIYNKAS